MLLVVGSSLLGQDSLLQLLNFKDFIIRKNFCTRKTDLEKRKITIGILNSK